MSLKLPTAGFNSLDQPSYIGAFAARPYMNR